MRARKGHARRRARKRLLHEVKGNWGARGKLVKMATETLFRARAFAFRDRRNKKREYRSLWIVRVTAACKARGLWPFTHLNRVHVVPPCTVSADEVREGLAILDEALSVADKHYVGA